MPEAATGPHDPHPDPDAYALATRPAAAWNAPELPYRPSVPRAYRPGIALIGAGTVALALAVGGRLAERALDGTAFQPAARSVVSVLTADAAHYAWWLAAIGVLLLVVGALFGAARRRTA